MIKTKRLILRNYTMDDFNSLFEIMSDPETMQHYPAPFDENRTKDWIIWNIENYKKYGFGLWVVTLKETGKNGKELWEMVIDVDYPNKQGLM